MADALDQIFPPSDVVAGNILKVLWKFGFFRLRGALFGNVDFKSIRFY